MKSWLKRSLSVAALGVAGAGIYLAMLQYTGNFSVVVPGEAYRSAQPSAIQLSSYARQYGIKTVLNLRGKNEDQQWYKDEVAEAAKLGLNHVDFKMSAEKELSVERSQQLIALLETLPKPILIHCKSGSDRTGLASALYVYKVAGGSEKIAEGQISFRFGHIGIPYLSSTYAMDETWDELEKKLFGLNS